MNNCIHSSEDGISKLALLHDFYTAIKALEVLHGLLLYLDREEPCPDETANPAVRFLGLCERLCGFFPCFSDAGNV